MTRTKNASSQTRALLAHFAEQPQAWQYGYDLSKSTGIGSGTLYPALARLSDQGLLESEWRPALQPGRPPRHAYRLTSAGVSFVATLDAQPAKASKTRSREAMA